VLHSLLAHLRLQAAPEEVTIAIRIQIHMVQELRVQQTVVLPTTGPLDQVMDLLVRPLMVEASQMGTILEARKVDPLLILPVIAPQAGQVLELAIALQVEVQVDPQVVLAQEDPEEGGINSPFFFENLSENERKFVTNPTQPFST
jgi:hypothetical protein